MPVLMLVSNMSQQQQSRSRREPEPLHAEAHITYTIRSTEGHIGPEETQNMTMANLNFEVSFTHNRPISCKYALGLAGHMYMSVSV